MMQELKKILEEIDFKIAGSIGRKREGLLEAEDIIRKHMNNGWIPIDEDNIPDHEILACNRYAEELIGYIGKDESGFYCESDGVAMGYITAWMEKPEPYRPERSEGE